MFALLFLLLTALAQAANHNVRFCPEVDTDYEDSDTDDGDYWDTNNRNARGFKVRVTDVTALGQFPPMLIIIYDDFVASSGTWVGCTSELLLSSTKKYNVTVTSEAKVGTNTVYSVDDDTNQTRAVTTVLTNFSPSAAGVVIGTPLDGATEPRWNHLAAAVFSLYRVDADLTGEDFFFMDVTECDDGSGNFYPCANEYTIHLGDTKWKYLVAHEVGHTVSMKRDDGGDGCQQNTGAPEDGCHGDDSTTNGAAHGTLTKEYLSSAMCEGMADFYSSMVWNTHAANDDCSFSLWYRLDWNEDYKPPLGALDTFVGDDYVCYGDPFSGTPDPVGAWDWLEDLVNADDDDDDGIQCTGVLANRSTSYDMERFLWGMLTVEGIPEADLWQIWDDADPHSWTANDGGSADPNCIAPTKVADRMRCAADALYGTEYANQDDHGLDH